MITPPPTVRNVQLWRKHCRRVRALAQRLIDGKVGVVEGSIEMVKFETWLHAHGDDVFEVFRSVYRETTDLPIGKVRELWEPEALKAKDATLLEVADRYRRRVLRAAQLIREKYELQ